MLNRFNDGLYSALDTIRYFMWKHNLTGKQFARIESRYKIIDFIYDNLDFIDDLTSAECVTEVENYLTAKVGKRSWKQYIKNVKEIIPKE